MCYQSVTGAIDILACCNDSLQIIDLLGDVLKVGLV